MSRVRIDQLWLSRTPSRQDILFGTFYFRFKVKHAHKDRIPTFSQSRSQSPRASLVLTKRNAASGNEIDVFWDQKFHYPSNLVPRVLWLFGQRMGASRDSGIMELRGNPVFVRMLNFKTEVKCPKMAAE